MCNGNTQYTYVHYCFYFIHQTQVPSVKSGARSVEERNKLINPLSHIGGQAKKPPLPSFRVNDTADWKMKLTNI